MFDALTYEQKLLGAATLGTVGIMGMGSSLPAIASAANRGAKWLLGWDRKPAGQGVVVGPVTISDEARKRHTHIVGATGSGKTVLMEHLLYRDLARGHGALIIDPKGEREFFERVRRFCESIGRGGDLKLLSATHMSDSVRWNPLRLGNASELQSKLYCSSKYEHSFYAKATELALAQAFARLCRDGVGSLTLLDLVQELDQLSSYGKDENLKGLYFDIQNLAYGEWAPILGTKAKAGNNQEVSLLDLTRRNEILFVDLPTEGKSVQSARVGSLLLQEITLLSGIRKRMPGVRSSLPFSVYIDEFDAFATDPFVSFLNKGRSSDFMIHMAHQTLSDLKKVSPTFMGQIMGSPNVFFIFRLNLPEDAEMLSKLFGTDLATKRTQQTQEGKMTGMGSQREVQEFRIHPDRIKSLKTGECVVSIKTDRLLEIVQIPPLTDRNLPQPELPIHRDALTSDSAAEPKATIARIEDDYSELMRADAQGGKT